MRTLSYSGALRLSNLVHTWAKPARWLSRIDTSSMEIPNCKPEPEFGHWSKLARVDKRLSLCRTFDSYIQGV